MTTIYENQKDIERERLSEEASSDRSSQIYSSITGALSVTTGSTLLGTLDKLDPSRKTLGKVVGIAGVVIGALSFGMSFLHHRWAKKAEDQIKQIDREQKLQTSQLPVSDNVVAGGQHVARYQQEQLANGNTKSL